MLQPVIIYRLFYRLIKYQERFDTKTSSKTKESKKIPTVHSSWMIPDSVSTKFFHAACFELLTTFTRDWLVWQYKRPSERNEHFNGSSESSPRHNLVWQRLITTWKAIILWIGYRKSKCLLGFSPIPNFRNVSNPFTTILYTDTT